MKAIEEGPSELDAMMNSELFALALGQDPATQSYKDTVRALRKRASPDMFEVARGFCLSIDLPKKELLVYILTELAVNDARFLSLTGRFVELLSHMYPEDRNQVASILESIIASLSHFADDRSIPTLEQYVGHPNAGIRQALAMVLGGTGTDADIEALVTLSRDSEVKVRNSAVFRLGTQLDLNAQAIRDALAARLGDEDEFVRCEAIYGLAIRKDSRCLEPALRELESGKPSSEAIEVGMLFPHATLFPALLQVKQLRSSTIENDNVLDEAIRLCQAEVE